MDRLTNQREWTDDIDLGQEMGYKYIFQRLSEYENAQEQGLLVWLPCKVGDTVFVITGEKYQQGQQRRFINTGKFKIQDIEKMGKTVFSTREAAEKALKKMEEKK